MESDSDKEEKQKELNKSRNKQDYNTIKKMKRKEKNILINKLKEQNPPILKPFDENILIQEDYQIDENKVPLSVQPYFTQYEKGKQLMKNMKEGLESSPHVMDVVMKAFENGLHKTTTNNVHLSFVLYIL